jgi:hypothetical protein
MRLPGNEGPNEPRVLRDGRTVLVNTIECRLYQVTGLEGIDPQLKVVHQEPQRGCAMPVLIGDYWVQAQPRSIVFSPSTYTIWIMFAPCPPFRSTNDSARTGSPPTALASSS